MKMKRILLLVGIGLPLLAPLEAKADCSGAGTGCGDTEQLKKFISASDFHKNLVSRALSQLPPAVFQRCPTLASTGSRVTVVKPVSFGSDGFPNAGMWNESFPVSGCGNDTTLNIFFEATADEKVNTIVGLPGTTHTSPTLQRDAIRYATMGFSTAAKMSCKEIAVTNTKFEGYGVKNPAVADPGPLHPQRPWWETWTLTGCSRTFDLPMDFIPDQTGTQIIQPAGQVERRAP